MSINSIVTNLRETDPDIMLKFGNVYMEDYRRSFSIKAYSGENGLYYFHVKVPSTSVEPGSLSYDVVLELNARNLTSDQSLKDASLRYFSNSPSFTYTYAYVFNKEDLLIPWLKGKYTNKVLNNRPEARNPREEVELDQSLKAAILYLDEYYADQKLSNRWSLRRIFRASLNQSRITREVATATQATAKNKEVQQKERNKKKRRSRVRRVFSNPLSSNSKSTTSRKTLKEQKATRSSIQKLDKKQKKKSSYSSKSRKSKK